MYRHSILLALALLAPSLVSAQGPLPATNASAATPALPPTAPLTLAAALALAVAYDKGDGLPADPQKALSLYKIAAVGGEAEAQAALGTYFYEGGTDLGKDLVQARAWFREAAIRGDLDGMVNLSAMLIKGEGGEADPVRAWAWLTLASGAGRQDAALGLTGLERRMNATDLASAKALVAPQGG